MLNIPLEMYAHIFAIAKAAGWCAHRIEEVLCGGGIIRPAYKSLCRKLNKTYRSPDERWLYNKCWGVQQIELKKI